MSELRKSDDPLEPVDHAERVALFRAEIVGALSRRELHHGELRAALRELREQRFRPPGRRLTRTYSVPTLERWYYNYKAGGLPALRPDKRGDAGHAQELTAEQRTLLCDIRKEHPSASAALIVRTLEADGRIAQNAVSEATVRRLFAERGLQRVSEQKGKTGTTTRLRWQAERPGALWHGDICHGPSIRIKGVLRPLRIHGLLDDNSRYIVALEAHHTECEVDMLGLLVRALRRHGLPDALYLDNGSTYRGETLRLACERLGITLLHARPYDPQARGKMERFWRTLRGGCLDFLGDTASLSDVQHKVHVFLDQHYHQAPHASLMGKAPGIVYSQGRAGQIDTLTEERLRLALTTRDNRRVRGDTTVSIDGHEWELEQGFLAGRIVVVCRNLASPEAPPWVEYEGKRLTLHPVDPVKNAHRKRPPRNTAPTAPTTPTAPVPFDPIGALDSRKPIEVDDLNDDDLNDDDKEIF
jgi:transposase InsO family protein